MPEGIAARSGLGTTVLLHSRIWRVSNKSNNTRCTRCRRSGDRNGSTTSVHRVCTRGLFRAHTRDSCANVPHTYAHLRLHMRSICAQTRVCRATRLYRVSSDGFLVEFTAGSPSAKIEWEKIISTKNINFFVYTFEFGNYESDSANIEFEIFF